jgi:DNA-binding IclR family transcriptional regulator
MFGNRIYSGIKESGLPGTAPAAETAADILILLSQVPERARTVSELAIDLGVSKTTCHRIALSLVRKGMLKRDEASKRYALGPAAARLGEAALLARDIEIGLRYLAPITVSTGLSCVIQRLVSEMKYVVAGVVDSPREGAMTVRVGATFPLPTRPGSVLAAWLPEAAARLTYTGGALHDIGIGDVPSLEEYLQELTLVRELGFTMARTRRERVPNEIATSISAPVFDHQGRVIFAASAVGVLDHHAEGRLPEFAVAVVEAATGITEAIRGTNALRPPLDEEALQKGLRTMVELAWLGG